jgi:hypothetical protein
MQISAIAAAMPMISVQREITLAVSKSMELFPMINVRLLPKKG